MKINFGTLRASRHFRWLTELGKEFCAEYDIIWNTKAREWLRSRNGSVSFVQWLQFKNWKVTYWELSPFNDPDNFEDKPEYVAYGIDIDETCERFIEFKLKYN